MQSSMLMLHFDSGEASLSTREFVVEEGLSSLFEVRVIARSPFSDIDPESIVGLPASFAIDARHSRVWSGLCSHFSRTRVEPDGLSTYEIVIVPRLWLLGQRRNNRLFQHIAIPAIVGAILAEWGIEPSWEIDPNRYPQLELRAQYDETDLAFMDRLLEEAGITYILVDDTASLTTRLVLRDEPQSADPRPMPLPFVDVTEQADASRNDYVTRVRVGTSMQPGKVTIRDYAYHAPRQPLTASASEAVNAEATVERYHHEPGSFLRELGGATAGATPVADDLGTARFDQARGDRLAELTLAAMRVSRTTISFSTNAYDLAPGVVFRIAGYPSADLAPSRALLTQRFKLSGSFGGAWSHEGIARIAGRPYRPAMVTPKPRIHGLQSAVVVGPPGEEIYVDEWGRVRVELQWDRLGRRDQHSSMWMRVSQGWAGTGYGLFTVPRVGQEVLVAYLDGDLDNPIIVGRVHNAVERAPHKLPDNKTVSTWKTSSSPESGGFNEIRFEDALGREMIYMQAQLDLTKLVKNDERAAIGRDRVHHVRSDDTLLVGNHRSKVVQFTELDVTGMTRTEIVGVSRNTVIGVDDTTMVGSKFSITIARGLTTKLGGELASRMLGPLAPVLSAPIDAVHGLIPRMPLGGALPGGVLPLGPISLLGGRIRESFEDVLHVTSGYEHDPGPAPTTIEVVDRKITLSTGEASIVLDGPNITLFAEGNIILHARKSAGLLADVEAAMVADKKVLVLARGDDLILQSGHNLHLNPFNDVGPEPAPGAVEAKAEATSTQGASGAEEPLEPLPWTPDDPWEGAPVVELPAPPMITDLRGGVS